MSAAPTEARPEVAGLARAATDAVVAAALRDGQRVGWVTWSRTEDAPPTLQAAGPEVYDGAAGVAWALALLAPVHDRPEELFALAGAALPARAPAGAGLLDGAAGLAVARATVTGVPGPLPAARALAGSSDHLDGLSGLLLATVSLGAARQEQADAARALLACGRADGEGWAHPGPVDEHGEPARPLTGLAHGSSGVLLALAHWLATDPAGPSADEARERLYRTWLWESAWADRVLGWPDLRETPPAYPALWCHGSAGVTATRLELCRLADAGVDLGVPATALRSQAGTGLMLCREAVERAGEAARRQLAGSGPASVRVDPQDAGLTLCHGLGGPLDVLASAAAQGDIAHLDAVRPALLNVTALLGDDPHLWPTGQRTRGGYGLFQGLSGTALVLARLAHPELGLPSPGLFGAPVQVG